MQSSAATGHDSPGPGGRDLSQKVGHGKSAALLKAYSGKMARSVREREQKVLISRAHTTGLQVRGHCAPHRNTKHHMPAGIARPTRSGRKRSRQAALSSCLACRICSRVPEPNK